MCFSSFPPQKNNFSTPQTGERCDSSEELGGLGCSRQNTSRDWKHVAHIWIYLQCQAGHFWDSQARGSSVNPSQRKCPCSSLEQKWNRQFWASEHCLTEQEGRAQLLFKTRVCFKNSYLKFHLSEMWRWEWCVSFSLGGCHRATSVHLVIYQTQVLSVSDWKSGSELSWLTFCQKQSWDRSHESEANSTEQNLLSISRLWASECKWTTLQGYGGMFVALVGQSLLFFLIPTLLNFFCKELWSEQLVLICSTKSGLCLGVILVRLHSFPSLHGVLKKLFERSIHWFF